MPSKLELALCVSKGSMIDIFDIHTGIHVRHIAGTFGTITALHDSLLVCCDENKNMLSVYNYRLNRLKWKCSIPKETKLGPLCVSATSSSSPSSKSIPCDPRFLFCGSSSGHIYCWCLLTGRLLSIFKAHLQSITCLTMSKDGNLLISGSNDCLCKVWKLSSMVTLQKNKSSNSNSNNSGMNSIKEYIVWKDHLLGITDIICANNERIFTAARDCTVKCYSLLSKQLISSISFPNPITCITIDAANIYLLVASVFGELWRINLINNPKFESNIDIQHITSKDSKTVLAEVTYGANSNNTTQKVAITGLDVSYDGRLAVSTHGNGVASIWDIKYGSKVSVLNKHRKCYDQVVLVCDRLGAFATCEADVKYEKFSLLHKNFPVVCKRFFAADNDEDVEEKINDNKTSLVYPPDYISINIPSGVSSAAELGVNRQQKIPMDGSMLYGNDSWCNDDAFLERIDDEFSRLHSFNENCNGFMIEMNEELQTNKKIKKLQNTDNMDRNMEILLAENRKLKGEIEQWKSLHSNLYNFACNKISKQDDDIQMFQ